MNTQIYINNENKWIVTDKSYKKVLLSHKELNKLQSKIKKLNIKDAVVMYVPPFNKTLAPKCLY